MPTLILILLYEQIERSPVENAIQAIKDKNQQLSALVADIDRKQQWSNNFAMTINGILVGEIMEKQWGGGGGGGISSAGHLPHINRSGRCGYWRRRNDIQRIFISDVFRGAS